MDILKNVRNICEVSKHDSMKIYGLWIGIIIIFISLLFMFYHVIGLGKSGKIKEKE